MENRTRKKKLGGYPAVGVVISITLALIVIGVFGLIMSYSSQFEKLVRENVAFKVYMNGSLSETQRKQVQQSLSSKDFVAKSDHAVTFVSKDDAAKEMTDLGNYEDVLDYNPYKDMFEVAIDPAFHDSVSLSKIQVELKSMNGVADAIYEKDLLNDINENSTKISIILVAIDAILLVTVILLINSTLRLALFSQRFLIRSMQLVGARRWFIQRPFLVRAALYGLLAGVLAAGILYGITHYAYKRVEYLVQLHNQQQFLIILAGLLVVGACISVFSTYFSIRRYLRMSLDDLY